MLFCATITVYRAMECVRSKIYNLIFWESFRMKNMIQSAILIIGLVGAQQALAQKSSIGQAQSAKHVSLENFFEGRMVELKLDMPATSDGVDVYPLKSKPIDFSEYADRLKEHGTAIKAGERMIITKVKTKDKHIEFQLGGGGYGTFGDESADVQIRYAEKSKREKDLEKLVDAEKDKAKKSSLKQELSELREQRERENAKLTTEGEQLKLQKQAKIRDKALASGSRFNIRYERELTAAEKTPESLMKALSACVTFPADVFGATTGATTPASTTSPTAPASTTPAGFSLKKGLTWQEVSSHYGIPKNLLEKQIEKLRVVTCAFDEGDQRIEATFVEEILVKYSISSR